MTYSRENPVTLRVKALGMLATRRQQQQDQTSNSPRQWP